ncbi:MAG TPA: hypothetical protein VFI19_05860 [Nocardioides sp.]|nr:hypothetical protein [Nocardioides sp.]
MPTEVRAFWIRERGRGALRPIRGAEPGPCDVLVRTLRSGVSRGTEAGVGRRCTTAERRALALDLLLNPAYEALPNGSAAYERTL